MTSRVNDEQPDAVEWIPYADKVEWNDVIPIKTDDVYDGVVKPRYDPCYVDIYDYLRAVQLSGEKSERVLAICKDGLYLNPANYSLWQFYRSLLKYLDQDLLEEMKYISQVISDNQKNYQVWYHRRAIVQMLDARAQEFDTRREFEELAFTERMLSIDGKNYHAWEHRQWFLLERKHLMAGEALFLLKMFNRDLLNNSVWNHRYFVLHRTGDFLEPEKCDAELDFVTNRIRIVIDNDSAWYYLVAVMRRAKNQINLLKVTEFANDLYKSGNRQASLLRFLVDVLLEVMKAPLSSTKQIAEAYEMSRSLIKELHAAAPIRKVYWQRLSARVEASLPSGFVV